MKKLRISLTNSLVLLLIVTASSFAQNLPIPANQSVVLIEPTPAGNLETIINAYAYALPPVSNKSQPNIPIYEPDIVFLRL